MISNFLGPNHNYQYNLTLGVFDEFVFPFGKNKDSK